MPCTFTIANPRNGIGWRSLDNNLRVTTNEDFHPMIRVNGGSCGRCGNSQQGTAWGSSNYILCVDCATNHFSAPNLRVEMPQLFLQSEEQEDEGYDEGIIVTKRDNNFDPQKYSVFISHIEFRGRNGCSGYRCETCPAPPRIIPAGVAFMAGAAMRGNLCMTCFNKLKERYNALPARANCGICERYTRIEQAQTTPEGIICNRCIAGYFIFTPETDRTWVRRESAQAIIVPATTETPVRYIYASQRYAETHWFLGAERWYATEAERDRELYQVDISYRDSRLVSAQQAAVFPYGTNVIKMHGFPAETKLNDLCFGVELEMQPNNTHNHMDVVRALEGKFITSRPYILCADSSIGDTGVEMITLPYTLANHKSDKYMPWTKVLAALRLVAKSGQNTTACGMHVHINRRALSHLQMGKMLVVINAPEMQQLIATIAQRNESLYARRFFKKVTEGGKIIGSHMDALNMSNSKGTVELRIFRGNLRYERVMKNLEFAEALCIYSLEQSIQRIADPSQLLSWLEDNRAYYPHLVKFLRENYEPTKVFARHAAVYRKAGKWEHVVNSVLVTPVEGDI